MEKRYKINIGRRRVNIYVCKENKYYVAYPGSGINPIQYTVDLKVKALNEKIAVKRLIKILRSEYRRVTSLLKKYS